MKEELYEKVGRKYVRVNDPWACEGLRDGHWHVWVRPHNVTVRKFILPANKEVSAAIEEVREAMIEAMLKANKSETITRPLSPKELKAVKAYRDIMGEDMPIVFDGISMWDLVDVGIKALTKHWRE